MIKILIIFIVLIFLFLEIAYLFYLREIEKEKMNEKEIKN